MDRTPPDLEAETRMDVEVERVRDADALAGEALRLDIEADRALAHTLRTVQFARRVALARPAADDPDDPT
jgi:hypothetical protein